MKCPDSLPPCPHLPVPAAEMDFRELSAHGDRRDGVFYESALRYGHYLWLHGHAGRALLAVARALYADVPQEDPVLSRWPLPYAAMAWMMARHGSDDFPGNPRISFQHQACRLRGPRRDLRQARAWAVWALACKARPQLPGDPACPEPSADEILDGLKRHGHAGEAELWCAAHRGGSPAESASVHRER